MQGTVDAIVEVLRKHATGMRSEQLQKALRVKKNDIFRPLTSALQQKLIRKQGQRRGTTYFAV